MMLRTERDLHAAALGPVVDFYRPLWSVDP